MTVYYEKKLGDFNMCGCMGPMYGEPHCPCIMARNGLPMSDEHVEKIEQTRINLEEFFHENQRKKT